MGVAQNGKAKLFQWQKRHDLEAEVPECAVPHNLSSTGGIAINLPLLTTSSSAFQVSVLSLQVFRKTPQTPKNIASTDRYPARFGRKTPGEYSPLNDFHHYFSGETGLFCH